MASPFPWKGGLRERTAARPRGGACLVGVHRAEQLVVAGRRPPLGLRGGNARGRPASGAGSETLIGIFGQTSGPACESTETSLSDHGSDAVLLCGATLRLDPSGSETCIFSENPEWSDTTRARQARTHRGRGTSAARKVASSQDIVQASFVDCMQKTLSRWCLAAGAPAAQPPLAL
jgi:hypothetical protein